MQTCIKFVSRFQADGEKILSNFIQLKLKQNLHYYRK